MSSKHHHTNLNLDPYGLNVPLALIAAADREIRRKPLNIPALRDALMAEHEYFARRAAMEAARAYADEIEGDE